MIDQTLPWKIVNNPRSYKDEVIDAKGCTVEDDRGIRWQSRQFVVRASNNHDALIEAVKRLKALAEDNIGVKDQYINWDERDAAIEHAEKVLLEATGEES